MSSPRYVPRDFARHPRDFGQKPSIEWLQEEEWTPREFAQFDAAHLQHTVAYGVTHLYMPNSPTKKMTTLAQALEVPYSRVQKLLTGHSVMQLEDLGRFRRLIGDSLDPWLLRGRHAAMLRDGMAALEREARLERERRLARSRAFASLGNSPRRR